MRAAVSGRLRFPNVPVRELKILKNPTLKSPARVTEGPVRIWILA